MNQEPLGLKDQFDRVCSLVAHEDDLISVRANWTLLFHGLLFTAYASGVGLYEKLRFVTPCFDPIATGTLLICLLGFVSGIAAYIGLKAAEDQLKVTTDWWRIQRDASIVSGSYPPLYIQSESKFPFGASMYFAFLAGVWVLLGFLIGFAPTLLPK